jgi:hypothetical protein
MRKVEDRPDCFGLSKAFPGEVEAGSPSGNATNQRLKAKIRFCKKRILALAKPGKN